MRVYARRASFSLCASVRDWVPAQLFKFDSVTPVVTMRDGPCCLVQFGK